VLARRPHLEARAILMASKQARLRSVADYELEDGCTIFFVCVLVFEKNDKVKKLTEF
jgi:hypothetical protein